MGSVTNKQSNQTTETYDDTFQRKDPTRGVAMACTTFEHHLLANLKGTHLSPLIAQGVHLQYTGRVRTET